MAFAFFCVSPSAMSEVIQSLDGWWRSVSAGNSMNWDLSPAIMQESMRHVLILVLINDYTIRYSVDDVSSPLLGIDRSAFYIFRRGLSSFYFWFYSYKIQTCICIHVMPVLIKYFPEFRVVIFL